MQQYAQNSAFSAGVYTGHADSYYVASAGAIVDYPVLREQIAADVCVVGGGYTGLSAALHLAQQGRKVVLLEAHKVGWGASGRNGGHVGTGQRVDQQTLEKVVGERDAKALWELSLRAVQLVKELIRDHHIECDLKDGILHLAAKAREVAEFQREAEHLHGQYNYHDVQFIAHDEVCQMIGSNKFHAGLLDTRSAHLHPLKYALGMARAAQAAGVALFENSRVNDFHDSGAVELRTARGMVTAKTAIIACNGYLGKLVPAISGRIMPINNYMLATEPLDAALARSLIRDDVAVSDSLFVINYWKLSADNRLLFGGGENYTRRFPRDIKSFVRKYMLNIYPQLEDIKIEYGWGGTLAITLKRMPDLGKLSPNVLYAQGYSGHGVPTATMAGKVLANQITGDSTDFELLASVPVPKFPGGTLLRWPGLVAGMLYYSLRDKL